MLFRKENIEVRTNNQEEAESENDSAFTSNCESKYFNRSFEIGDKVRVQDPGLKLIYETAKKFDPEIKPNNIGFIKEFFEDGDALIEFPIGDDPMEEHSQVAPYPVTMLSHYFNKILNPNIDSSITPCIILNSDEYEMVWKLAASGSDIVKIAKVLEKDVRLFKRDWKRKGTPIYEAYYGGSLEARGAIDEAVKQSAIGGNLTAIQQYEKRIEEQKLENLKEELFNTE